MTFGAPFTRVFRPPFGPNTGGGGAWWNLFGTIPNANVVAAYQPKGASSLAASYSNLVTPGTYDAAPGTAPTWDAVSGWIFNGSTQYLKSGVIPTNLSWSVIARCNIITTADKVFFGSYEGATKRFHFNTSGLTTMVYGNGDRFTDAATTTPGSAVWSIAALKCYRNAIFVGNIPAGGTAATIESYIGARNNGTPGNYMQCTIQAIAIYNNDQSANMAALYTAIAAL